MIERLLFLTGHAAALIVLASTCYAKGTLAVRRASFRNALEELCAASTIGFGITGTVLFLTGLARMLYAPVVVAYVLVVHACPGNISPTAPLPSFTSRSSPVR